MFEKNMRFPLLLDAYGELLSEHRREIFDLYYSEDLSLSEISENTGISRQGVRESIKKTEAELLRLEECLGLVARQNALSREAAAQADALRDLLPGLPPDAQDAVRGAISYLQSIHF